jgi:hypothetical protein
MPRAWPHWRLPRAFYQLISRFIHLFRSRPMPRPWAIACRWSPGFSRPLRMAMPRPWAIAWICLVAIAGGCAWGPTNTWPFEQPVVQNPVFVACHDPTFVFNQTVDVVDDYFSIDREESIHVIDDVITEGRIETLYQPGATVLDPWLCDSANGYEKLESTLQSIRRRATVRVVPAEGGFLIDVAVFKELENLPNPEHSTAGAATLRYDGSIQRFTEPVAGDAAAKGWIPLGRDLALEQLMLAELQERVVNPARVIEFR